MTALEYMEKQARKCQINYERELMRGAPKGDIINIVTKLSYYLEAADALRKVGDRNA